MDGLFASGTLGGENASLVATAAVSREDGLALVASYGNTTLAGDLDIVTVFNTIYRYAGTIVGQNDLKTQLTLPVKQQCDRNHCQHQLFRYPLPRRTLRLGRGWPVSINSFLLLLPVHLASNLSDYFFNVRSRLLTRSSGINDNGSGSSGILEVAIQLAKGGWSTIPTVRFGWWTAEEEGLLGAESYVAKASAAELARIRLYLNFDMIASPNFKLGIYDGDGSEFGLSGPAGSDLTEALFEEWFESIGQNHSASEFNGRSDYGPFLDVGIPSGGLDTGADDIKTEEDVEKFGGVAGIQADPNYHSAADNVTNLSLEAFEIMGKGIAHAVAFYGANGFAGYPERNTTAILKSRNSVGSKPRQTDLHPRRRKSEF